MMNATADRQATRLVAFVGTYGTGRPITGGGIAVFDVSADGRTLAQLSSVDQPKLAGYLVYSASLNALYAVDERKTDGRGPVEPAARIHAFRINRRDCSLQWLNSQPAPGARPTFLAIDEEKKLLVTANHGDFDHVEHVVPSPDGKWSVEYSYDDSTVVVYELAQDGSLGDILDVVVLTGHGKDPNRSPQAGGHAQASPHAHCAVIDPSRQYVLVCDKATDRILVFHLRSRLSLVSAYKLPEESGPRHLAFDPLSGRAYVTCEFSSELASFDFNQLSGELRLIDKQFTVAASFKGANEPAEVRVHHNGEFVYVNNRGEDSVAWFLADQGGRVSRRGQIALAKSIHPGLAARSFDFAPSGSFMIVADRPANVIRSYSVDARDGSLSPLTESSIADPAFVAFAELPLEGKP